MADILIKGMEMPKEGFVEILIRSDGTIVQTGQSKRLNGRDYYVPYDGAIPQLFTAVSVPPHGRLIDADALLKDVRKNSVAYFADYFANEFVGVAPTIIPAESEDANDKNSCML